MAGAEPSLWVVVSGAGTVLLAAIGKLWALTLEQRNTITRQNEEILALSERLHEAHKTDLRAAHKEIRSVMLSISGAKLCDIPWAPSLRPRAIEVAVTEPPPPQPVPPPRASPLLARGAKR